MHIYVKVIDTAIEYAVARVRLRELKAEQRYCIRSFHSHSYFRLPFSLEGSGRQTRYRLYLHSCLILRLPIEIVACTCSYFNFQPSRHIQVWPLILDVLTMDLFLLCHLVIQLFLLAYILDIYTCICSLH